MLAGLSAGAYGATNITLQHLGHVRLLRELVGLLHRGHQGRVPRGVRRPRLRANSPLDELGPRAAELRRLPVRAYLYQGRDRRRARLPDGRLRRRAARHRVAGAGLALRRQARLGAVAGATSPRCWSSRATCCGGAAMSTLAVGLACALAASVALNGSFLLQHVGSASVEAITPLHPLRTMRGLLSAPRVDGGRRAGDARLGAARGRADPRAPVAGPGLRGRRAWPSPCRWRAGGWRARSAAYEVVAVVALAAALAILGTDVTASAAGWRLSGARARVASWRATAVRVGGARRRRSGRRAARAAGGRQRPAVRRRRRGDQGADRRLRPAGLGAVLGSVWLPVAAGLTVLAFFAFQRSLQSGRPVTAIALMTAGHLRALDRRRAGRARGPPRPRRRGHRAARVRAGRGGDAPRARWRVPGRPGGGGGGSVSGTVSWRAASVRAAAWAATGSAAAVLGGGRGHRRALPALRPPPARAPAWRCRGRCRSRGWPDTRRQPLLRARGGLAVRRRRGRVPAGRAAPAPAGARRWPPSPPGRP